MFFDFSSQPTPVVLDLYVGGVELVWLRVTVWKFLLLLGGVVTLVLAPSIWASALASFRRTG
jgi:hypothetical protein